MIFFLSSYLNQILLIIELIASFLIPKANIMLIETWPNQLA